MPCRRLLSALALFILCLNVCAEARAQADKRERAATEIESLREQIKAREAELLAPSDEDRKTYAEFLARPDTGLIRLLPREKWGGKLSTNGGGAFYSFTRLTHEYGYGSDVMLEQGNLMVGFAGADFGFMIDLCDVPLEDVSEETEKVRLMASFKTPAAEADARAAKRQFGSHEGPNSPWTYRSRLPVIAGCTYALRSINYGDSDVLVAFNIVRRDTDGSVVLLWKMVAKYPKPSLQRSVAATEQ
ncbi:MAG TPA: hypothetical protein VF297_15045 [Pyrinomonadaceae bacterium]